MLPLWETAAAVSDALEETMNWHDFGIGFACGGAATVAFWVVVFKMLLNNED